MESSNQTVSGSPTRWIPRTSNALEALCMFSYCWTWLWSIIHIRWYGIASFMIFARWTIFILFRRLLVYTLTSNSWRELSDLEYLTSFGYEYKDWTDNDVYYWLSEEKDEGCLILLFDFTDERCQEIIHTPTLSSLDWPTLDLHDGCIALIHCSDGQGGLDLLVLERWLTS